MCHWYNEDSEAEKLLQLSRQELSSEEKSHEEEEEGLIVADYESDDETKPKTKYVCVSVHMHLCCDISLLFSIHACSSPESVRMMKMMMI